MKKVGKTEQYQGNVQMTRRCHECNEEALGRCLDCRFGFCQNHFPKQQHSPCAEKQMKLAQIQVCYVCGVPVYPDQWSISPTSHFIDEFTCRGCGRYICNELHTQHKEEEVIVTRDGLRGHRYQCLIRYCDLCAPIARVNGIKGLTRLIVIAGTLAAIVFFYFHP